MWFMPLLESNGYFPDFAAIPADDAKKAKLMVVNYSNNPTAATAPASFYDETIRFAADNGIVVVSDFAYGAIGFDGKRPISFLERPGAKEVGVEMYVAVQDVQYGRLAHRLRARQRRSDSPDQPDPGSLLRQPVRRHPVRCRGADRSVGLLA